MIMLKRSSGIVPIYLAMRITCSAIADDGSELKRVQAPEYADRGEVRLDIGDLITSGSVQPASAISVDEGREGCWLLRTTKGPKSLRWYRNLLNVRADAPDLVIDAKLKGFYDIHVEIRAVHAAREEDAREDFPPMAFEIALSWFRTVTIATTILKKMSDTPSMIHSMVMIRLLSSEISPNPQTTDLLTTPHAAEFGGNSMRIERIYPQSRGDDESCDNAVANVLMVPRNGREFNGEC